MRNLEQLEAKATELRKAVYVEPEELATLTKAGAVQKAEGEPVKDLDGQKTTVYELRGLQFFTIC